MTRGRHAKTRARRGQLERQSRASMWSAAFAKDMLRAWGRNWKRFVSLAVISMLGVAVLTGIYAGCRDMFQGADRFFDQQRLYDIQVISTLGLTKDDVSALQAIDGVKSVQAERTESATVKVDGSDESVTLSEIGADGMNQPYLQQGRLPKKSGEMAVTRKFVRDSGLNIGDTLTVAPKTSTADTNSDENDAESNESDDDTPQFPTKLTITGIVLDPLDLQNPDGYSQGAFRSSATSEYTFFLPSAGVTGSTYTAISLELDGTAAFDTFTDSYDSAVRTVRDRIEQQVQSKRQRARRQQLIDDAKQQIDDARSQADAKFADAQSQIDAQRSQFNAQVDALIQARGGKAGDDAQRNAIIASNTQLTQAKQQLDDAQAKLDQQKTDTTSQLDEQESKIESDIPQARWYVNTRSSAGTFSSLKSDLSSIESIGRAFPIVFLLVAVFMSLTAMTRMVEEERGLIGTYMGLGYGSAAIASRYVLFALLACLIGGGLGDLIGFLGIPAFLLIVLEGMYVVPNVTMLYDWLYGSAGVALFVLGIGAATIAACWGEVRQTPAALMRPKAPKAGSRVLLEYIGPLWRRMKFLNKVTARNLFRFKGRLFMTIGGVAGCTALIVCGLAINDTVDALPATQYQDIYQYQLMVVTDHDQLDAVLQKLKDNSQVRTADSASTFAKVESGELTNAAEESETVQLVTVPEAADLKVIADLRNVDGGEPIDVSSIAGSNGGVIVSQSAANALDVHAGDSITVENGDAERESVRVAAVSKSVIGSDIYLTADYYSRIFGTNADTAGSDSSADTVANGVAMNAIFAQYQGSDDDQIAYADKLAKDADVLSVVSTADMQRGFSFDLMGAVVALIVALAGALALVVLFTLANTNVSERVREMATLKVLGFYDREVHKYVNREMLLLTLMGIAVGLPLGRWIGGLLTAALNMPGLYFAVTVRWTSYAIAAVVTLAFALLVQLFTNPVLDRIDPVSSLKSVE
ncbi:ABC transporter [Bifidobacterium saguini DSM 23967]|uniref:ABC transporter n=3 Tax=Bifidobacterium saguini TaxID=762210 RepID=A0A087DF05_9BIFI|nr:ABC transporter [Bifidobacterium saguini DSM 23967]